MHCVYSSDDTKAYVDNDFSVVVVVRWSEHEEMRMRLNSLDNFARKEAHEMIILLVKTSPLLPLQLHSNHEDGGEGMVSLILLVASTAAAAFLLNYHSPESAPAPSHVF